MGEAERVLKEKTREARRDELVVIVALRSPDFFHRRERLVLLFFSFQTLTIFLHFSYFLFSVSTMSYFPAVPPPLTREYISPSHTDLLKKLQNSASLLTVAEHQPPVQRVAIGSGYYESSVFEFPSRPHSRPITDTSSTYEPTVRAPSPDRQSYPNLPPAVAAAAPSPYHYPTRLVSPVGMVPVPPADFMQPRSDSALEYAIVNSNGHRPTNSLGSDPGFSHNKTEVDNFSLTESHHRFTIGDSVSPSLFFCIASETDTRIGFSISTTREEQGAKIVDGKRKPVEERSPNVTASLCVSCSLLAQLWAWVSG